jgi:hypothetical protein
MGEAAKRAGYDCWWPTCDKTVQDEPLVRTRPKGQPGEFMCAQHAEQKRIERDQR